jgi:hypothetical protein
MPKQVYNRGLWMGVVHAHLGRRQSALPAASTPRVTNPAPTSSVTFVATDGTRESRSSGLPERSTSSIGTGAVVLGEGIDRALFGLPWVTSRLSNRMDRYTSWLNVRVVSLQANCRRTSSCRLQR